MKRKQVALLCVILAGVFVSGCGGEHIGETGDERAVSGSGVSGTAVSEKEKQQTKGRYCSDTNLYIEFCGLGAISDEMAAELDSVTEGEEVLLSKEYLKSGVMQTRLDGSCKKEIDLGEGFLSLIGVADHWLYYTAGGLDADKNIIIGIFRVPIEKNADGYDEVKTDEPEEIIPPGAGVCSQYGIYADEKYLFYPSGDKIVDEQFQIVKYDLQNRKEVVVQTVPDGDEIEEIWRMGDQYMMYVRTIDTDVFAMPLDGTEWEWITDSGYILEEHIAYNDQFLFYDGFPVEGDECGLGDDAWYKYGTNIRMYDGKKEQSFVTWKQLREAVEKEEGLEAGKELTGCEVTDLFCEGNRCYIQVQADWTRGGIYYMKYLIFSKETGEKRIRYEKEWTECMRKREKEQKGKWYVTEKKEKKIVKENSIISPVHCMDMVNGKAYFSFYNDKTKKRHAACYEPATGHFYEITGRDAPYYELFYDEPYLIDMDVMRETGEIALLEEDEKGISEFYSTPEIDAYFEPDR